MNLGWITGMGMKCKSPKVLEESAGENLCDLVLEKIILDLTQKQKCIVTKGIN
jgi:bifunctional N-acetylglucosamine-1-phosphate-uridyltransferase/glucosamine-1-phosphate-acetyltransferase GlmU-like protein